MLNSSPDGSQAPVPGASRGIGFGFVRPRLAVVDRRLPADTGRILAWDGSEVPW